MQKVVDYRPEEIEFTVESKEVPSCLGEFESVEEAHKFMNENFVTLSSKFTAERKMDLIEIQDLRDEYIKELEESLPYIKSVHHDAAVRLEDAKKAEKDAKEAVNASLNKIQTLSNEVKEGVTEINLDQAYTYEVVHNGKRYYYTIIDGKIQLAGVREVPLHEVDDLISSSERNSISFQNLKKASGE